MKQRLIAVWSGLQPTVVDEAVDEQKRSFYACKWIPV